MAVRKLKILTTENKKKPTKVIIHSLTSSRMFGVVEVEFLIFAPGWKQLVESASEVTEGPFFTFFTSSTSLEDPFHPRRVGSRYPGSLDIWLGLVTFQSAANMMTERRRCYPVKRGELCQWFQRQQLPDHVRYQLIWFAHLLLLASDVVYLLSQRSLRGCNSTVIVVQCIMTRRGEGLLRASSVF